MKYPVISTILSLVFWVVLIAFFMQRNSVKAPDLEYSLEVDAAIVDEEIRQSSKAPEIIAKNAGGDEVKNNEEGGSKSAKIATRELPQIPDELRQEAFSSYAIARFYILANGEIKVELIKPCSNPELNRLLLKSLRKWRFEPAVKNGVAIDSSQDIRVDFRVE